ncbi:protein PARALOG OF AIPP2-like [Rutidosis leptorrhynchoides]|uniref:protein PARALOG OF AIPP2-like n=1 Tax=Rutidosis leptorrhynchoides TaxID=125765 RepID=UPI003A990CED
MEKADESLEEENTGNESETSLQNDNADDSDESDVLELDVEVCDICGDAGREDLLAICCKCPDGAEHIYCMRVPLDEHPGGNWVCEMCRLDEVNNNTLNTNRQKFSTDTRAEKDQSSDPTVVKVSGKRRAEELESSSSFKKQALETITESTKAVDSGPRSQSLKGALFKSNSFSFPNGRSKPKLVDEAVLQRQISTKERSSHEGREMGKSMLFRSANLGRFGSNGSKVKMLSPNSLQVQDFKSLKNKKERTFERTNSVKSSTLSSSTLASKNDRLLDTHGECNPVSSSSNSEAKFLKGDSKLISGLKSTNRPSNIGAEVSVSQGPVNNASEQKSSSSKEDNLSKLAISKESTNHADEPKENSSSLLGQGLTPVTSGGSCQNNKPTGHSAQRSFSKNAPAIRNSKDVKNSNNSLKDAIEAALLKKPGIFPKNKVSGQSDESAVSTMNNVTGDRLPHSQSAGYFTSSEVSTEWQGQILRKSNVDHSKQSNGSHVKQSVILSKMKAIPDHECIWQGGFEINRSGKAAEYWDGLQAHLSTCASSRVFDTVNNLPCKILLNGVSRISAWPSQFEKSGVKEDNVAIYFFAKDVESYEKTYQVLLDDMIRGDLALIGSVNGVELLIFPSNQLPEKSSRWNMVFFLWGVFRGKKMKSQVPKISTSEDACLHGSMDKEGSVNVAPAVTDKNASAPNRSNSQDIPTSNKKVEIEPKTRAFIDLSEDDDITTTNHINTWRDVSGQMAEEGNVRKKKQKSDMFGQNSKSENVFHASEPNETNLSLQPPKVKLALDLNEDIPCLVEETEDIKLTKEDKERDVASSPSLSSAFSPPDNMVLFRDM